MSIMSRRKKREDKKTFLEKFLRLVFWPVLHPVITIILLLLLWFVPTLIGAKPTEVHKWYAKKITSFFNDNIKPLAINTVPMLTIKPTPAPIVVVNEIDEAASPKYDVNERRKIFTKIVEAQKVVSENIAQEDVVESKENAEKVNTVEMVKPKVNISLDYLKTPEVVTGEMIILNANKVAINNKTMYLFGVYVDPQSQKGLEAQTFLFKKTFAKEVTCNIVAYSKDGAATAYCNVDNQSINHMLVDQGYSKNIMLGN